MEDKQIIELFFRRDEQAIQETVRSYGSYCRAVAANILPDEQDVEEVLSDTWMRAWDSIPPNCPAQLKLFLAKIARNLALNTYRLQSTQKRGGGQVALALEELAECVPNPKSVEAEAAGRELRDAIQTFLDGITQRDRMVFVRRYFYMECPEEIGARYGLKTANVHLILSRTRKKLKKFLTEEGYVL